MVCLFKSEKAVWGRKRLSMKEKEKGDREHGVDLHSTRSDSGSSTLGMKNSRASGVVLGKCVGMTYIH